MIDPKHEDRKFVEREFKRMGFDKDSRWRISDINKDFELCNTYPRFLILPFSFKDEDLDSVAKFRYFRRIPTAVWRHIKNGCFIVRSSQPTVGWFGWFRNDMDEYLVQSYVNNTIQQIETNSNNESLVSERINDSNGNHEEKTCAIDDSKIKPDATNDGSDKMKTHTQVNMVEHVSNLNEQVSGDIVDGLINLNVRTNGSDIGSKSTTTTDPKYRPDQSKNDSYNDDDDDEDKAHKVVNQSPESNHNHLNNHPIDITTDSPKIDNDRTAESDSSTRNNATLTNGTNEEDSTLLNGLLKRVNLFDRDISTPQQVSSPPKSNINGNGVLLSQEDQNLSESSSEKPMNKSDSSSPTPTTEGDMNTANTTTTSTTTATVSTSKMLIIDARSYAAAMANRAKGGGCECSEYYQRCEVHFMNLANIHSIRKSYQAIRSVCEAYSEQSNNWVSFLDNSRWLHHISGLIKSALLVVDSIDIEEKSIMIHCSDGWDRTPQLVALAEVMLDSHYRTFDGFKILIQREWLDFGHKFADRCGSNPCNEDPNERCPVFLQWLDCVQQLLVQYPKHFEFNSLYLDKLNRHTYSNVFGTFSYNSSLERTLSRVNDLSLWAYFDSSRCKYTNENYVPSDDILRPSYKVKDLHFWKEVYLPPINEPKNSQTTFTPITNSIDNNKCSQDSLFIDGLTRTVCK